MNRTLALLTGLLVAGCFSWANREGPDVTCTDLGDGATNACQEGIIARCVGGEIEYEVCKEKSACEMSWQTEGHYACEDSDTTGGTGGTGGNTYVGGTGGSGASGTGSGGTGGTDPSGGTGGGSNDDCSEPCVLGSTGDQNSGIDAFAIDATNAYFTNCESVWSVPKAGGIPSVLATGLSGSCDKSPMQVDADAIYVLEATNAVVRVPKAGGAIEQIATGYINNFALGETDVFWIAWPTDPLVATPLLGGQEQDVVMDFWPHTRMVVVDGMLYWGEDTNIRRVDLSQAWPATPVAIPVGFTVADFAIDGNVLYFVDGIGEVGKLDLVTGNVTDLATDQPTPKRVGVAEGWVYYNVPGELRGVNGAGGSPRSLADLTFFEVGFPQADESFVYYVQFDELMKVARQ